VLRAQLYQASRNQSLLALIKRVFKQLDQPWWKRTWQVSSPRHFEHSRAEVCSATVDTIHTPVYGLLGSGGYLPEFLSEKYMHDKAVRAFLDIFHNKIIDIWIRSHQYNVSVSKDKYERCSDVYGLKKVICKWYKKRHGREIRVEIKQFCPEKHTISGGVVGRSSTRCAIGCYCALLSGVHIVIDDKSAIDDIRHIAANYCGAYGRVSVYAFSAVRVGYTSIGQ
jgi:hypothetical protein